MEKAVFLPPGIRMATIPITDLWPNFRAPTRIPFTYSVDFGIPERRKALKISPMRHCGNPLKLKSPSDWGKYLRILKCCLKYPELTEPSSAPN